MYRHVTVNLFLDFNSRGRFRSGTELWQMHVFTLGFGRPFQRITRAAYTPVHLRDRLLYPYTLLSWSH